MGNLAAGPARRGLLAWEGQVAFDTLVSSGTAYIDAGHSADDRYGSYCPRRRRAILTGGWRA